MNTSKEITEEEEEGDEVVQYTGHIMMNTEEKKKQSLLEDLKELIGKKTDTPITVAVIGMPGAGKSSFINTMITSITGKYRQWTRTGNFRESGQTVTPCVIRIAREKYMSSADKSLQEYDFPDFFDIAGFQNTNDEILTELLRLIFYGRIPSNFHLDTVAEDIRKYGTWFTDKKYPETPECKKIDRVVFVASAASSKLPEQLMQAVSTVLRIKRDIPIFGVLTKEDQKKQKEEEFKEYENIFKTKLGLAHLNYLHCTNYCDDNINEIRERIMTHYPKLDIPVLKFLIQVLDPVFECTDFHKSAGFSSKRLTEWLYKIAAKLGEISNIHLLFIFVVTLLIAIILALMLFRP